MRADCIRFRAGRDCGGVWRRTGLLTARASLSPEQASAHAGPRGFYFRLSRSGACGERALCKLAPSLRRHGAPPGSSKRWRWTPGAQGTVGLVVFTPSFCRARRFRASCRLRARCPVRPPRGNRGRGCVGAASVGRAGNRGDRRRHAAARGRGACPRTMCVGSARGAAMCLHLRRLRVFVR